MVSTKKHEALSQLVESSKHTVTKKEKQKVTCHVWLRACGVGKHGFPTLSYEHKRIG